MRASLGQPVIVENVTGAGSTIGVARAARAEPDGNTLCIGTWTSHAGSAATYRVRYDVLKDFVPIALLPSAPTMIVGRGTLPASNLEDLIAWLKAIPGKASAGTIGGSPSHVVGVLFQMRTDTQFAFWRRSRPCRRSRGRGILPVMDEVKLALRHPFTNGSRKEMPCL